MDIIYRLTQEKMLMIGPFRGDYTVSFRNYVIKNGQHTPTKDGIALSIKVWRNILEIQDEINRDIDLVI
jgi:hypothetical protein